jgi:outer membrane protein OmpA-like peptidoglycan-associated protein
MIAERKREEETLASARTETANAEQALTQAQEAAREATRRARSEADDARAQADAEHAARERAEADAQSARQQAAEANKQVALAQPKITVVEPSPDTRKSDLRMGLLDQLNGVMAMLDTTRGLVATVPDSDFSGSELHPAVSGQLTRLAAIVMAQPGLRIDVEGNSDTSAGAELSSQRAEAIRRALIGRGFPESRVTARGLGDTHLFGPNASAAGRAANRRAEIVISGDLIGDLPLWDHPYSLVPHL